MRGPARLQAEGAAAAIAALGLRDPAVIDEADFSGKSYSPSEASFGAGYVHMMHNVTKVRILG